MCFSVLTNFKKLGAMSKTENSKSFRFIQGIRFLTMFLVVMAHGFFWKIRGPIKNPEWVEEVSICSRICKIKQGHLYPSGRN
jgi:peptidoglycan/LPS O-acetylase OafA/YrhL